jgi:hypothetical protein
MSPAIERRDATPLPDVTRDTLRDIARTGKDDLIREYLDKKIPPSVMARLLYVHRLTVSNDIRTRKLQQPATGTLEGAPA